MANDEYFSDVKGAVSGGAMQTRSYEVDDDLGMFGTRGNGSGNGAAAPMRAPRAVSSETAVGEVAGDAPIAVRPGIENAGADSEVGTDGTESGEEVVEATAAQLAAAAAESGEESAVSDLRGIEGYEPREAATEGAPSEGPMVEVGAAATGAGGGQQEFLPILAALAPTLISTVGPMVAKAVVGKLSPRVKRVVARLPRPPLPLPASAGALSSALAAANGGGGAGNLVALVAQLLKTAQQKPAGESGAEVDETLVNEAAAALEVIIGTDDRVRITNTTQIPWRRICALRITFPSGATYRGSGFLIGPRAVATAGHCVFLHDQGGWARRVEVIPGANGSARPFGQATSTMFRSVSGWVRDRKPASDYGCVVLPMGAFGGQNLGSFGFAAFDAQALVAQPAVVAGYPGDKPFAEAWGMSRVIKTVTAQTLIYDIDTMGGQSGAPVYIKRGGQRYVVGIHNYGNHSGNSATRITAPVLERLKGWAKL